MMDILDTIGTVIGVAFVLLVLIVTFHSLCLWIAGEDEMYKSQPIEVYCKSIDGTYGGGVCYKDGVKMVPEEEK